MGAAKPATAAVGGCVAVAAAVTAGGMNAAAPPFGANVARANDAGSGADCGATYPTAAYPTAGG
eukprot:7379477-Prymnesium_polylepis.1